MKQQRKYKINRFPICQVVYYALAKVKGYKEEEARAFGNAVAVFYALAKYGRFNKNKKKGNSEGKTNAEQLKKVPFFEREFKVKEVNGTMYPVMGNQIITEENFNKTLKSKLNEEEINALLRYAVKYCEKYKNKGFLNAFNIYKAVRDEWRTYEFWNKILTEV